MKFTKSVACWWFKPDKTLDSSRVFAFDLDQTLVSPKSGSRFPRSGSDWKWQTPHTKETLQRVAKTATIVIFTNQGAVLPNAAKKSFINLNERVNQVLQDLALPNIRVYAACKDLDKSFRKPAAGMWTLLEKDLDLEPDLETSIYVGDAAGRKQDHADTDLEFAKAVKIKFLLPEEFEAAYAAQKRPAEEAKLDGSPDRAAPKKAKAEGAASSKEIGSDSDAAVKKKR